jgi:TolA-binding protein
METLIYILIIFFVCLIGYQLFLAFFPKSVIEGLENETDTGTGTTDTPTTNTGTTDTPQYQPYQGGSVAEQALSLSKQNEYNIEYLNGQVEKIIGVKDEIDKLKEEIDMQGDQINDLGGQVASAGQEILGDATTDSIGDISGASTGTDEENVDLAEADIDAGDETQKEEDESLALAL